MNADQVDKVRGVRGTGCVVDLWPKHETLGTQSGPGKNGRKW
jgi:hypothetical protein